MNLPAGFEALAPFAAIWAQDSAAVRDAARTVQSPEARQAFYAAMNPLITPALDYLDTKPLAAQNAGEGQLMRMALAYAHVATAIEVQGVDEARHAINRQRLPITVAPADL